MYLNNSDKSPPMSLESVSGDHDATYKIIENPMRFAGSTNGLRSIEEIHPKFRHVFQYPYFNKMQSQLLDGALYSDKSMVVSAPTGSGKTVIFELAIVRLIQQLELLKSTNDFKIIYMAPMRALCTERLGDWYRKFHKLGLPCIEVTGDSETLDFNHLKSYKIIMTTPEKWDAMTRRWKENKELVHVIKLFIIDEVHLLNEDVRGPVLEAVVSRMKTIQESLRALIHENKRKLDQNDESSTKINASINIRFIAASATIPNAEDIAEWLGSNENPAICYKIGEEFRPVKLVKIVEGYPCRDGQGLFKFDLYLNYKLRLIIERYCSGKPTLIFCNTRKSVMLAAETLSRELIFHFTPSQKLKLTQMASQLSEKKLQTLVVAGIGCHHAGFMQIDRNIIEQIFRDGNLPVLITTSTLATGVNLPAHLVIIKTTQHYVNGAYTEYEESSVLQMMGRAGRPQFDTEGVAVIMTRIQDKGRYDKLCSGQRAVESKLHRHLAEHLNAEVALGNLPDLLLAMDWLKSTFLYVRATRNPSHYGCTKIASREIIEKKLQEICIKWMNALARAGLLTMDADTQVFPTDAGILMATYCLDFETMKLILKLRGTENLNELVTLVSECHEFQDIPLRTSEKRCLNLLNKNVNHPDCRFSMAGKIKTKFMKANCLIQAVLGNLPIFDSSLHQESMRIVRTGENITKCIVAYLSHSNKPVYRALLSAITLAKCFAAKMWENSDYVLRQLTGIGPALASLLVAADKTSFQKIRENNPRDLERILNKGPPAGNILKKQVTLLPIYSLNSKITSAKCIDVSVSIVNYENIKLNGSTTGNSHKLWLIVGDSENNLLHFSIVLDNHILSVSNSTITRKIQTKCSTPHTVYAHCISCTWVGLDVYSSITINNHLQLSDTSNSEVNKIHASNIKEHDDIIESSQKSSDVKINKKAKKNNPPPKNATKKSITEKTSSSTKLEEQIDTIMNKIKPCKDLQLPCDKTPKINISNKNNAPLSQLKENNYNSSSNKFSIPMSRHLPVDIEKSTRYIENESDHILLHEKDTRIITNPLKIENNKINTKTIINHEKPAFEELQDFPTNERIDNFEDEVITSNYYNFADSIDKDIITSSNDTIEPIEINDNLTQITNQLPNNIDNRACILLSRHLPVDIEKSTRYIKNESDHISLHEKDTRIITNPLKIENNKINTKTIINHEKPAFEELQDFPTNERIDNFEDEVITSNYYNFADSIDKDIITSSNDTIEPIEINDNLTQITNQLPNNIDNRACILLSRHLPVDIEKSTRYIKNESDHISIHEKDTRIITNPLKIENNNINRVKKSIIDHEKPEELQNSPRNKRIKTFEDKVITSNYYNFADSIDKDFINSSNDTNEPIEVSENLTQTTNQLTNYIDDRSSSIENNTRYIYNDKENEHNNAIINIPNKANTFYKKIPLSDTKYNVQKEVFPEIKDVRIKNITNRKTVLNSYRNINQNRSQNDILINRFQNIICLLDENDNDMLIRERTFQLTFTSINNQPVRNIAGSFSSIDCKFLHRKKCKNANQMLYSYAYQNIAKLKFEFNLFGTIKKYLINKKIRNPMEISTEMKNKIVKKKRFMRYVTWKDPLITSLIKTIGNNSNDIKSTKINNNETERLNISIDIPHDIEDNVSFNTNSCKFYDNVSDLNLTTTYSESPIDSNKKYSTAYNTHANNDFSNVKHILEEERSYSPYNSIYKYEDILKWIQTSPFQCVDGLYIFSQNPTTENNLSKVQSQQTSFPVTTKNYKPIETSSIGMEIAETLKKHVDEFKKTVQNKIDNASNVTPQRTRCEDDFITFKNPNLVRDNSIKFPWKTPVPFSKLLSQNYKNNKEHFKEPSFKKSSYLKNYQYEDYYDRSIANSHCESEGFHNENILDPQWVLKNAFDNHKENYNPTPRSKNSDFAQNTFRNNRTNISAPSKQNANKFIPFNPFMDLRHGTKMSLNNSQANLKIHHLKQFENTPNKPKLPSKHYVVYDR